MDTLFRSKHRSRNSASSTAVPQLTHASSPTDLTGSVPYSQIPSSHPPPVAGPSTSTLSFGSRRDGGTISVQDVGAPNTNPSLADGVPFNLHARGSVPPPSPRRSEKSRQSSRTSTATDTGGRLSINDTVRRSDQGGTRYSPPAVLADSASINGFQFAGPSVQRVPSHGPAQLAEFGGQQHPYAAAARDPDAMSIRSVSSVNSTNRGDAPIRDLGRYPSFTDSRGSLSSRSTHTLVTPRSTGAPSHYSPSVNSFSSNIAGTRVSEEFHFPRPPDHEIDDLFQRLVESRNPGNGSAGPAVNARASTSSQLNIAKTAASLPIDTKWQMVEGDARARYEAARAKRRKEEELVRTGKIAKRGTAGAVMKNSPEWFLKKCLDGTLTVEHVKTLIISLRTQPLE